MTAPKFKIGDRVKWVHFGNPSSGFVRAHISDGWWKVEYKTGCMANFHKSCLSLDVPAEPRFKIGDRVKYHGLDGDALGHINGIETSAGKSQYYLKGVPELYQESSLSLDVPAEPRFKVGDRVRRIRPGWAVVHVHEGENYTVTKDGVYCDTSGDVLSLDVPEPKQSATKLEVELGAEIIRLNFQILDQRKANALVISEMAAEIGNVRCERFAKEMAQKELAEANAKIKRLKSVVGEL